MNFIDCDSLKRTLIPANFMNIYDMVQMKKTEEMVGRDIPIYV